MQGANIGPRNFIVEGQVMIEQATTQADAQASAEQAVAAINAALASLGAPCAVSFSAEKENGQFVFAEPG